MSCEATDVQTVTAVILFALAVTIGAIVGALAIAKLMTNLIVRMIVGRR